MQPGWFYCFVVGGTWRQVEVGDGSRLRCEGCGREYDAVLTTQGVYDGMVAWLLRDGDPPNIIRGDW